MDRSRYKLAKIFDDVIKMRQLKNSRFFRVLVEYLKTVQVILTKLTSVLGNHI